MAALESTAAANRQERRQPFCNQTLGLDSETGGGAGMSRDLAAEAEPERRKGPAGLRLRACQRNWRPARSLAQVPGSSCEMAVFTLIQREGEARSQVVDNVKAKTLKGIIRNEVEGTAHIMTDQMQSYHGLGKEFASHGTVDHSAGGVRPGRDPRQLLGELLRSPEAGDHRDLPPHLQEAHAALSGGVSAGTGGRSRTRSACSEHSPEWRASGSSTAHQSGCGWRMPYPG